MSKTYVKNNINKIDLLKMLENDEIRFAVNYDYESDKMYFFDKNIIKAKEQDTMIDNLIYINDQLKEDKQSAEGNDFVEHCRKSLEFDLCLNA